MLPRTMLVSLLALVAGCGGANCKDRIGLFDARLQIAAEVRALAPPDDLDEPVSDVVPREETRTLPIVELRESGLHLDRRPVDEARLRDDLAMLRRNWNVLYPQAEHRAAVALWADRDLPMSRVLELAATALADHRVLLMARARTHPHASLLPRCPASIRCAALASSADPARALGEINTRAVGSCTPAIRAFGSVAGAGIEDRLPSLRRGLVGAARECGCDQLDLDALEYAILLGEGALEPPSGGFVVPPTLPPEQASMTVQRWIDTRR